MALILKNGELEKFCSFLLSIDIGAKSSRLRSRFLNQFAYPRLTEMEESRMALIQKHGKKDENGGLIVTERDGQTTYEIRDIETFTDELEAMLQEEFRIDELPERKDMLVALKNIVLNEIPDDVKFSGVKAIEYDRWCDAVDAIEFEE